MVCVSMVTMVTVLVVAMVADTDGIVKVLSDKTSDRLLGVHIIGAVSTIVCHDKVMSDILY